jgi:hypothetical protein
MPQCSHQLAGAPTSGGLPDGGEDVVELDRAALDEDLARRDAHVRAAAPCPLVAGRLLDPAAASSGRPAAVTLAASSSLSSAARSRRPV